MKSTPNPDPAGIVPRGERPTNAPLVVARGVPPRLVEVAVVAIWRDTRRSSESRGRVAAETPDGVEILAARRPAHAIRGGVWELPGGKLESGEPPTAAARREVREEVGVELDDLRLLLVVEHDDGPTSGAPRVRIHAFVARARDPHDEVRAANGAATRWVPADELDRYAWPAANHVINRALRERFVRAERESVPPA